MIFKNREEAGRQLAAELLQYRNDPRGLILALPRGGEAELIAHSHAAARKGENETPRVVTILQQLSGKLTACLFTVLENH